jgi:Xaa-Pro aminopeptidase
VTLLIYGSPEGSPDMFHAIPTGILDPFLYIESDGRRGATVSMLDSHKVSPHGIEIIDPYDLGADELLDSGISRHEVELELCLRAAQRFGVTSALVPSEFPVGVADRLRAGGVELVVDPEACPDWHRSCRCRGSGASSARCSRRPGCGRRWG